MNEERRKVGKEHRQDAKPAKRTRAAPLGGRGFPGCARRDAGASQPREPQRDKNQKESKTTDYTEHTDFRKEHEGSRKAGRQAFRAKDAKPAKVMPLGVLCVLGAKHPLEFSCHRAGGCSGNAGVREHGDCRLQPAAQRRADLRLGIFVEAASGRFP